MIESSRQIQRSALGNSVRSQRLSLKLTQTQVALLAGLDRSCISRLENGYYNINLDKLVAIAEVLQVEPSDLLNSSKGTNLQDHQN